MWGGLHRPINVSYLFNVLATRGITLRLHKLIIH